MPTIPFTSPNRRRASSSEPARRADPPSAKEFYLARISSQDYAQYDSKYTRGKNILDDHIENEALALLFARHVGSEDDILEIGAYSGRITRKLESYSDNITVSDTSPEILRGFDHPKMTLDLRTPPGEIAETNAFDAIISFGNQVSFSCDVSNAISVFARLLKPGGVLAFDIWNESLPASYDPPYPIEKSCGWKVSETLRETGFELIEFRSGCRLPYVFPRLFSRFFSRASNTVLFRILFHLEKLIFRVGILKDREQTQIFIARKRGR